MKKIKKNWLQWFIGFCDAEANFQVFPKKRALNYYNIGYGFHLSLSLKDHELIKEIYTILNVGKIYEYDNERQEIRLSITKLEDLNWLITNIFEIYPLLTSHQRERYYRLKFGVMNKFNHVETIEEYNKFINTSYQIKIEPYDLYFDNWMSGFINGEGSFNIHSKGHLVFYIEQAESLVLEFIKTRLDLGPNILFRAKRKENRKDTYSLAISSKKDISSIIKFFENSNLIPLKGNKLNQFLTWKEFYYSSVKYK